MRKFLLKYWKWELGALVVILLIGSRFSSGALSQEWVSAKQVKFGSLDVTVNADGAMASDQSVDLTPRSSGIVTDVVVDEGQSVIAGQLLLALDDYEASLSVRNAQLDVETAQVKLSQLKASADAIDQKTAENALSQAEQDLADVTTQYNQDKTNDEVALQNAQDDLEQERVSAYSVSAEAFAELPTTLSIVDEVLQGRDYSDSQDNIDYYYDKSENNTDLKTQADDLQEAQNEAESTYNEALAVYNDTDVNSDSDQIVTLINSTYDAVEELSVLLKKTDVFLLSFQDYYPSSQTVPAYLQGHIDTIEATIATLNPQLSILSDEVQILQNLEQDVSDAERAAKKSGQSNESC